MDDALKAQLEAIRDIEEIKRLKSRYFRAVDDKDTATFRELFTEEATFEVDGGRIRRGRDEIVKYSALVRPEHVTVHLGHTPDIELTGPDTARAVWGTYHQAMPPAIDGLQYVLRGYGHYHDEYVKRDGRWLIASLVLIHQRVDYTEEPADARDRAEEGFRRASSTP